MPAFLKDRPRRDRRSGARVFGRVRVSTLGLIVAFFALFWVYETYSAPLQVPEQPVDQLVPPGYVPDPDYTWVPRTNVRTREAEPTTTTPTTTSVTETTTSADESPTPGPDGTITPSPTTTVVDPDGSGPLNPQTFTQTPPLTTAPSPTTAATTPTTPTTQPPP
ncbi:MAG: hypothetical protein SW019_07705 [Actinomycetota bacterium]|nr:hypothetical protein [Actinomycetota bacterium]